MQPVNFTYYCSTSSFSGSTFGALSATSPPGVSTTMGWNTGRNNPPLFSEMNWNLEVVRTDTQWLSTPTGSRPNMNTAGSGGGNCWVLGPLNGEFLTGNWTITMSFKSVTAGAAHTGQVHYRIWNGSDVSGSNATLTTGSFLTSSIASLPSNTTTIVPVSSSFVIPNVNLHNEYVFVQTYWSILTSPGGGPGNNNVDNDFVLGSTSAVITTAPFVSNKSYFVRWNSGDYS
jgi:hypothetical protein